MDAEISPLVEPAEPSPVLAEPRQAVLAKLRELFGGDPDPEMFALARERDRIFERRLAATP
ncbi:hypothetical protein GCM10017673_04430 [Streptosporangium violaceochromogenes]|nr:hypothetical protein GCM10017673_04430 [Streptosporangium violaceochromogenes]